MQKKQKIKLAAGIVIVVMVIAAELRCACAVAAEAVPPLREQVEYRNLLPYQFKERMEKMPLAYIPVGSLEWHGEHMCVGTDGVKAEALCCLAARQGGGIVLPGLYLGILGMTGWGSNYTSVARSDGLFYVEPDLFEKILSAQLTNLDRLGFKGAIIMTGHYSSEQVALVKKIAANYKGEHGIKVAGLTDQELAKSEGHTGDHAAKWETSIMMYLKPEFVHMERLSKEPAVRPEGVYGNDPRTNASAELGGKVVAAMVKELCETGKGLIGK